MSEGPVIVESGDALAVPVAAGTRGRPSYRWMMLVLCFLVMTTSFVVRIAWSNVETKVGAEMSLNPTLLGSFVTAFFAGYVAANAIGGFLVDIVGARRVALISLLPLAILVAAFGIMRDVPVGLAIQFGMGLAAGMDFAATTKLAAAWFESDERGTAFGVLSAASSTALIFTNTIFPSFVELTSWHTLYFAMGAGVIGIAVLCFLMLREAPLRAAGYTTRAVPPLLGTLRTLVRNKNFIWLSFAVFGALWGTWGVTFWGNTLMVKGYGLSNTAAGQVTTLLGIGGLIAKPSYGWLSDRLPVRRKMMLWPCFVGFAAMLLLFGRASSEAEFRLLAPILGVFAFIYGPLTSAMLTEVVERHMIGAASGLFNSISQASTIIAPVAVGYVYQRTASFEGAFGTLAIGPIFAAFCVLMVNEKKRQRR